MFHIYRREPILPYLTFLKKEIQKARFCLLKKNCFATAQEIDWLAVSRARNDRKDTRATTLELLKNNGYKQL
jgi:hypothetical protein